MRILVGKLATSVTLIAILVLPIVTNGAKIMLAMSTLVTPTSRHIVMSAVAEPLVAKGHQVILLAPKNKITKGLSKEAMTDQIFFESPRSREELQDILDGFSAVQTSFQNSSLLEKISKMSEMFQYVGEGCTSLFKDKKTLDLLLKERFDLVLTMPEVGCDCLLAEYLQVPFVVVSPSRRSFVVTEDHFGIPIPSSYVPFSMLTTFTDKMTFTERLQNNLFRFVFHPILEYIITSPLRQIKRDFNIRPELTLSQVFGQAEIAFVYSNFALEYAQPTAPNWVTIGGISAKPSKPLPQIPERPVNLIHDLQDFVEGSGEHGIIIFTLGSAVTSLENEELAESIAKVFSELPQRVLWRYKGKRPDNVGNNTLISDWLPQNDLLGHPKTRMLIYHGGSAGVYEATSHGVPLLLMPLAADQMGNAARVETKGLGRAVDKNTLTEDEFREAINDILTNSKYQVATAHASGIMKDQLATPQETVVYWVEHILKFGGSHLRSRALELNFIQRNSLDVISFLSFVFLAVIFTLRWIICSCCCRLCVGKRTKTKKD